MRIFVVLGVVVVVASLFLAAALRDRPDGARWAWHICRAFLVVDVLMSGVIALIVSTRMAIVVFTGFGLLLVLVWWLASPRSD